MELLMQALIWAYIFIVGLCVGSFMNVVAYRLPRGQSVVKGRSACPKCAHKLAAADLIPVVSRLFLRGRCRYCGAHISVRYTLVELLYGVLAAVSVWRYSLGWQALCAFAVLSLLAAIALCDADTMEIPDQLTLALALAAVTSAFAFGAPSLLSRVIGTLAVSLPLWLLTSFAVKDSFGGGDIKLFAVCGFLLGWQRLLVAAFIAIVAAGAYGCWLLATKRGSRGTRFAFGPFIAAGAAIALLCGDELISFYLQLFF